MRALMIDTETTGLPGEGRLLEVAYVDYDLAAGGWASCGSHLIAHPFGEAPADPMPMEHVHGISHRLYSGAPFPMDSGAAFHQLRKRASACEYVLAHNAEFDRHWIDVDAKPWVCTMSAVEWPGRPDLEGASLINVALAYGVGIVRAHRAIEDCLTMAAIFSRLYAAGHDLVQLIHQAASPRVTLKAHVSYADRDLAKAAGFRWSPEQKIWWKTQRADRERDLPFKVSEVQGGIADLA